MKLAATMVSRTLDQFDAKVIPDNHPAVAELNKRFGEHTFFLDDDGLSIIEPTKPEEVGQTAGMVVNLASWSDKEHTNLEVHQPEITDVIVELGPAKPNGAA